MKEKEVSIVDLLIEQAKADERAKALDEAYKAFEEIDSCEFAMFSLCLIRETLENVKGGKNDQS